MARMSLVEIFSRKHPIDVSEFLRWNINWLDVLSKILYHNFVDEFFSRNKQKAFFDRITSLCCICYHFVNSFSLTEDGIWDFFRFNFFSSTSGKGYTFWFGQETWWTSRKHFLNKIKNIRNCANGENLLRKSNNRYYFSTKRGLPLLSF